MSKTADYLGLVAYMFVMYGGLPGSDSLWSSVSEPEPARRQGGKLKIVASNPDRKQRKRRGAGTAATQEFAA